MGFDDKIKNNLDKAAGAAKEAVGDATNDDGKKAEGKGEKSKADLLNAGENIKDAFKN
ncbi:CsbD family protein [Aeromicrobium sp. CTD01-1L150]|uniref:CsbD family protein n=1 Tax=Aeromicrobium sp. CTD01-1L150 TaxID=3341830 RepID=UPI0035C151D7